MAVLGESRYAYSSISRVGDRDCEPYMTTVNVYAVLIGTGLQNNQKKKSTRLVKAGESLWVMLLLE